jgi:hypothetical protein
VQEAGSVVEAEGGVVQACALQLGDEPDLHLGGVCPVAP